MLNDALLYRKMGWSVVPACWPAKVGDIWVCGCGSGHEGNNIGKVPPAGFKWGTYQEQLPTLEEVTEWWTKWPLANIIGITGKVSGLVVVDVEYEGLKEAARLDLHSGLTSLTGKGKHLFYKHPGERICNQVAMKKIKGYDLRGDGGYVILPPSRHQSGRLYKWATGITSHLPYFPSQLINNEGSNNSSPSKNISKLTGQISELLGGLSHGNRNNTFAQIVGRLHRDRWTPGDIRSFLLPHASRVEFPEKELDIIVGSVTRYPVAITGRGGMPVAPVNGQLVASEPLTIRRLGSPQDKAEYDRRISGLRDVQFPTGFTKFDRITGGLQRGELLTIAARTETGKTNWVLRAIKNLASANKRVLLFSTEMSYERIWARYIPIGDHTELDDANFLVADAFTPDIPRIAKAIEDERPDLFVFDHINIIGDETAVIADFMKGLKALSRRFNIPGIVSAQLNRTSDWLDPKTGLKMLPRMSMIKGSSAIEETSAQVLLLHEQSNDPTQKQLLGIIEKNRYGEKDNILFILKKHPYRMEEGK